MYNTIVNINVINKCVRTFSIGKLWDLVAGRRITGEDFIGSHRRHSDGVIVGILETKLTAVLVVGQQRGSDVGGCYGEGDIAILLLVVVGERCSEGGREGE